MPRGRPRTSGSTLPPCYHESHGAVYHIVKNKWRWVGTAADAHAEYAERLRQGGQGKLDPLIDVEFENLKTLAAANNEPWSPNTLRAYKHAVGKLKHHLRAFTSPEQVKHMHAVKLKTMLAATPGVANFVITLGRQVFAAFVVQELTDTNPFVGVTRFRGKGRDRLIKQEEWDRIYNGPKTGARLRLIMDGLFLTDQRVGDVLKLDERDILDDGPGIYFKQQKTGKELIIEWNPQLREWVAKCRALHGKVIKIDFEAKDRPRPLFRARHGRRPSYQTVRDQWAKAVKAVGVEDCTLRDNRAFSATEAKRQGLDPQLLLGHTTPQTTRIYLRGREIDIVQGPQMKRTA